MKLFWTLALLVGSKVFMITAWYYHLKRTDWSIFAAIAISWLIALPEYCLQVPSNRMGHVAFGRPLSAPAAQNPSAGDHAPGLLGLQPPHPEGATALDGRRRPRSDLSGRRYLNARAAPHQGRSTSRSLRFPASLWPQAGTLM